MKHQRIFIIILTFLLVLTVFAPVRAQDDATTTTTFFLSEDNSFSVQLPEGWFASGDMAGLYVANREDLVGDVENFDPTDSGDLTLTVIPLAKADFETFGFGADATLVDIATMIATNFQSSNDGATIGEAESFGDTVARITIADDTHDGVVYVADNLAPGYIGVGVLATIKGELTQDAEAELLAIVPSINYSLTLDGAYTAGDGVLSFAYPEAWATNDLTSGVTQLADSQATLDKMIANDDVAEGESRMVVIGVNPSSVPADLNEDSFKTLAVDLVNNLTGGADASVEVDDPLLIENEALMGGAVAYVPFSSEKGEGGLFLVNNEGLLHAVVFSGVLEEGHRLYGTALAIANSTVFTLPE